MVVVAWDLSGLMVVEGCVNRMTRFRCRVPGTAGGGEQQEREPYRFLVHAGTLAPI
jgi:hypothetical protein